MIASADLMERGFEVYHGLSGRETFDLVAVKDAQCVRVEVKLTRLPMFIAETDNARCDLWAIVDLANRTVAYDGKEAALMLLALPTLGTVPRALRIAPDRTKLEARWKERVAGYLTYHSPASVYEMAAALNISRPDIQRAAYNLVKDGRASRVKQGRLFVYASEAQLLGADH